MSEAEKADVFAEQIGEISDESIRTFVRYVVSKLPDYFFEVSASSSGKYHPDFAAGQGGLVRHVKAGVEVAKQLLVLDMFQSKFSKQEQDIAIASVILHDGCKRGKYADTGHTNDRHPVDMANFISECHTGFVIEGGSVDEDAISTMANCVASHMGQWNKDHAKVNEILPLPKTALQKFVHLCDYIASRKFMDYKETK